MLKICGLDWWEIYAFPNVFEWCNLSTFSALSRLLSDIADQRVTKGITNK